ncbi:MAG: TorF family putative porin [Oleispira antarctica]|uniref:Lipoprotein n=1 Tax=Oleispira antarctica RB-8 TaxID=698738 RepID=R4YP84_OLEAN|nr:TorF family putative porin [Oleispira antarctica]MBQ0793932.1 TorF family putative porin [Oleispira antarctica]CCK76862.1 conserved hypothetical protein [Oleispira antarctica RB-8]
MNARKKILVAATATLLTSTCFAGEAPMAENDPDRFLSGNLSTWVELATDYVFRGESETNDGEIPSAKISLTWTHDSGVYVGAYYANNLFPADNDAADNTNAKINAIVGPYIGIAGDIVDSGFKYSSMLFQYIYPGDRDSDYLEMFNYMTLPSIGDFTAKLEFSPTLTDWFGVDGLQSYNYAVHGNYALPADVTLSATYGFQEFDEPSSYSNSVDWQHWNVGVSKVLAGWNWDVRYHDTDIEKGKHDFYGFDHNYQIVDPRYVVAVSRSF